MQKKTVYLTEDGTYYDDEADALFHERKQRLITVINKMNLNTECMGNAEIADEFLRHADEIVKVLT